MNDWKFWAWISILAAVFTIVFLLFQILQVLERSEITNSSAVAVYVGQKDGTAKNVLPVEKDELNEPSTVREDIQPER